MRIELRLAEQAKKMAHREGRTITKYVIAQETGLAFNTVDSYWENRAKRVDLEVLIKLCDYFGCYLDDLMVQIPTKEDVEGHTVERETPSSEEMALGAA